MRAIPQGPVLSGIQDAPDTVAGTGSALPKPVRVQLSRKKGWTMPPNTVKVTRPGKWGNPFVAGKTYRTVVGTDRLVTNAQHAVSLFHATCWNKTQIREALAGKNLACWCKLGEPCHADILLELANEPSE